MAGVADNVSESLRQMRHNRWFRIVLAFPLPLVIAWLVTAALGTQFRWFVFASSELIGMLAYMGCLRLLGLDPMRYYRRYPIEHEWEREYLWPEAHRLQQGAVTVLSILVAFPCVFILFSVSAFEATVSGVLLGQWSYEGVRIFQGVYDSRRA